MKCTCMCMCGHACMCVSACVCKGQVLHYSPWLKPRAEEISLLTTRTKYWCNNLNLVLSWKSSDIMCLYLFRPISP